MAKTKWEEYLEKNNITMPDATINPGVEQVIEEEKKI
jgi:hypothetical protein